MYNVSKFLDEVYPYFSSENLFSLLIVSTLEEMKLSWPRLVRTFCPSSHNHNLLTRFYHHLPGKDATEAFEDVGHSDEARALLPDMLVGTFDTNSVRPLT